MRLTADHGRRYYNMISFFIVDIWVAHSLSSSFSFSCGSTLSILVPPTQLSGIVLLNHASATSLPFLLPALLCAPGRQMHTPTQDVLLCQNTAKDVVYTKQTHSCTVAVCLGFGRDQGRVGLEFPVWPPPPGTCASWSGWHRRGRPCRHPSLPSLGAGQLDLGHSMVVTKALSAHGRRARVRGCAGQRWRCNLLHLRVFLRSCLHQYILAEECYGQDERQGITRHKPTSTHTHTHWHTRWHTQTHIRTQHAFFL